MIAAILLAGLAGAGIAWLAGKSPRGSWLVAAAGLIQATLLAAVAAGFSEEAALAPLNRIALLGLAGAWFGAALGAPAYYAAMQKEGKLSAAEVRGVLVLTQVFMSALAVAAASRNLAIAWVALEATTITGAFLVARGDGSHRLEAAWKFAVLCFGGVGFCLVGIGLLAAAAAGTGVELTTDLDALSASAGRLDPTLARLGFAALVAGFGAKAGLVPMHWWLPDAHSQSPSPVSALMSGGLVATSLVILVEARTALAPVLGLDSFQPVFIGFGLAGLTLAVLSMIRQPDIKRLLAWSTVEHVGLMVLAVGIGTPLAAAAFAIHVVGHALAKAAAFLAAGGMVEAAGSRDISRLAGSLDRTPASAASLLVSGGALLGFPVGPLFISELMIIVAAARVGMPLLALAVTALLALAFAVFVERMLAATLGRRARAGSSAGVALTRSYSLAPAALLVAGAYLLIARPEWAVTLARTVALEITGELPW